MQQAATGGASDTELVAAVLDHELFLFSGEDGSLYSVTGQDGQNLIQAFTSAAHLPPQWEQWQRLTGRQLVRFCQDHDLQLNPGTEVSVRIPRVDIVSAVWDARSD